MSQSNDKTVIELQNILACKKEELVQVRPVYSTNMQFRFYQGGPVTNLHTVSDVSTLIRMYACVRSNWEMYDVAATALGVEGWPQFKWEGFEHTDWKNDIQTKLGIINYQAKKAEYEALERRLLALESDDLKTSKELEAIMTLLNK